MVRQHRPHAWLYPLGPRISLRKVAADLDVIAVDWQLAAYVIRRAAFQLGSVWHGQRDGRQILDILDCHGAVNSSSYGHCRRIWLDPVPEEQIGGRRG
jgi:hypothetical protein